MYSSYLFIGVCGVSGSLIYNGIENLCLKPNVYESRREFFNYGMFMGLALGVFYSEYYLKLIKLSE